MTELEPNKRFGFHERLDLNPEPAVRSRFEPSSSGSRTRLWPVYPIPGMFSRRRLRKFTPKEGTKWAEEQKLIKERCAKEENERRRKEEGEIAEERLNENQVITTAHTNELLTNMTNHEERMVDEESRDRSDQGDKGTATRRGGHMEYALAQTPD